MFLLIGPYEILETFLPILDVVEDVFGEDELFFSFLFLSINASNINGLEESGLI